jgi:hypothetical protein
LASDVFTDPPLRADGLCAVCLEPRLTRKLKPVYQGEAAKDPFCSNVCAREWYGIPLPSAARPAPRGYVSSLPDAG